MKSKKMICTVFASLLMMVLCLTAVDSSAQSKKKSAMKECCMMKDGKMMHHKDGKMVPMTKDMTMKNGTKCMVNGECVMKDGKTMTMKEGDCMDMNGKDCKNDMKKMKGSAMYACPMHADMVSDKPAKCPKCGMDMTKN